MGWVIIGLASVAAVGALLVYVTDPGVRIRRTLRSKARTDYRHARGTIHKSQLLAASGNLERQIHGMKREQNGSEKRLHSLPEKRQQALRTALIRVLVNERMVSEIQGIGENLGLDIIDQCFRGTLDSLLNAHRVHGVGQQRQLAICTWVDQTRRKLPALLEHDFAGKAELVSLYDVAEQDCRADIQAIKGRIKPLVDLQTQVTGGLKPLNAVSEQHFLDALLGAAPHLLMLARYHMGLFAEWEQPPSWFRHVLAMESSRTGTRVSGETRRRDDSEAARITGWICLLTALSAFWLLFYQSAYGSLPGLAVWLLWFSTNSMVMIVCGLTLVTQPTIRQEAKSSREQQGQVQLRAALGCLAFIVLTVWAFFQSLFGTVGFFATWLAWFAVLVTLVVTGTCAALIRK